ncbi:MAG: SDR family oxidoreductase [Chloroflexi bacterium]|nr:SDR family oxidoreductase [Chloroflexota bacterium]
MKLDNKVAIITGAGGGLGREIALAFAGAGASLVLADINVPGARAVAAEVRGLKARALPLRVDITRERGVHSMVERALRHFGKIDILVNNAGVGFGSHSGWGAVRDLTVKNWENVLRINLTGAFICSKLVAEAMVRQKSGVIINISSGMGKKGLATFSAYTASKFGLEGLTQVLALELAAFNIRCNTLAPGGLMATPPVLAESHTSMPVILKPSVIREAIVWLASDEAAGINGQALTATVWNEQHGIDNAQFKIVRRQ